MNLRPISHEPETRLAMHYRERPGLPGAVPVVFVHGLGGFHDHWADLAPLLAPDIHGYAVDLPGFGERPPVTAAPAPATVAAGAAALAAFLTDIVSRPAVVIGNSMGALIAAHAAAGEQLRPGQGRLIRALVLIDLPLPPAQLWRINAEVIRSAAQHGLPGLGEYLLARRLATVPARQRVMQTLQRCCADPTRVSPPMVDTLLAHEEPVSAHGRRYAETYLGAARSIVQILARRRRYWNLMASVSQPVLLVHGVHDRLVPVELARDAGRRHPQWQYAELHTGHIPHIETPAALAEVTRPWLAALPPPAEAD